jgi:hypothetical protein
MNINTFLNRLPHSKMSRFATLSLTMLVCCIPAFCGEIHDAASEGDLVKVMLLHLSEGIG